MMAPENLPWVTVGVDLFDVLVEQMAATPGPLDVTLFCNVLSTKDARRLRTQIDSGRFRSLRLVVDRGTFVLRQGADDGQVHNAGDVEAILGAERIRGICTHLKAVVWEGDAGGGCLISSANLNHNNRPECHDRADHMAGPLLAIADELFAEITPGVVPPSSHAYRGIGLALDQVRDGWDGVEGVDTPPDATRGGIYLTTRVGMADVLPGLIAAAGDNPRIWASTWSLKPEHITVLCGWRDDGVDVRLWVPARFAARGQNAKILGQVANLADEITWSPVHGKIVVVSGDRASYLITGCANLGRVTNLDCFRVRVGGFELAEYGCALLEALPTEEAPALPPPEPLAPPKQPKAKATAHKASWGIPASALAVSPDFQPFTGIAASDADLWDERDRLAMLADLHEMIRWAWPKVNPGTVFVDNWHLHELCRQYMAFVHGTCAETTLNAQPPGTGKSTIISQIGPVWGWLHYPHHRWGFASHSLAQAIKDSTFRRALIADPDFQRIFRPGSALPSWEIKAIPSPDMVATVRRSRAWRILKGKDGKALFGNTAAGYMRAASTGAKITGDHFDRLMGDDLLDGKDRAKPEGAVDWTVNVFFTRVRDGAMKWINGQRLHPRDPIGVLRDQAIEDGTLGVAGRGGVDYLCFPHHYAPDDPDRQCASSVGVTDQRTYKGELLDPRRFPESVLKAKSRDMGPLEAAAQLEQNTRLEAGMLFPADKWGRFGVDPGGGRLEVSVDSSNWSNRKGADLTSITLSRIVDGRVYRLAHWPPPVSGDWGKADRYSVTEVVDILAQLSLDYPMIGRWLVENKAGGMGLMQLMVAGGQIGGRAWKIHAGDIVAVNPQKAGGDLKFRADAAARAQNKGLCFVLTGAEGDKFIKDCANFPNVWPDDPIASWVQQVIDPEISLLLGHRPAPVKTPRPVVKAAAIQSRRGGGFR